MPYADIEQKRARDRLYYQEHRTKILTNAKAWQEANPERVVAKNKAWREANIDKIKADRHNWYLANRETVIEAAASSEKRRRKEDPVKFKAQARDRYGRQRARRMNAYAEKVDPWVVWERDQGICQICGDHADPDDWHLDHIVAIRNGGPHTYENVQVAHPQCNWRKTASQ